MAITGHIVSSTGLNREVIAESIKIFDARGILAEIHRSSTFSDQFILWIASIFSSSCTVHTMGRLAFLLNPIPFHILFGLVGLLTVSVRCPERKLSGRAT